MENTDFIQIIDENSVPEEPKEIVREYDKDYVHYIEYSDGSMMKYTHTLPVEKEYINSEGWKTKKEYVTHMNLFIKILYYLWIIVLYKTLPVEQQGHLINNEKFLQTVQGSTYSTYWHWNWWNPLTYIVIACFCVFMLFFDIIISIIQTLKITSVIQVKIDE